MVPNPDTRPLPPGWSEHYDTERDIWFYINSEIVPPRMSSVHPADVAAANHPPTDHSPLNISHPPNGTLNSTRRAQSLSFAQQLYASAQKGTVVDLNTTLHVAPDSSAKSSQHGNTSTSNPQPKIRRLPTAPNHQADYDMSSTADVSSFYRLVPRYPDGTHNIHSSSSSDYMDARVHRSQTYDIASHRLEPERQFSAPVSDEISQNRFNTEALYSSATVLSQPSQLLSNGRRDVNPLPSRAPIQKEHLSYPFSANQSKGSSPTEFSSSLGYTPNTAVYSSINDSVPPTNHPSPGSPANYSNHPTRFSSPPTSYTSSTNYTSSPSSYSSSNFNASTNPNIPPMNVNSPTNTNVSLNAPLATFNTPSTTYASPPATYPPPPVTTYAPPSTTYVPPPTTYAPPPTTYAPPPPTTYAPPPPTTSAPPPATTYAPPPTASVPFPANTYAPPPVTTYAPPPVATYSPPPVTAYAPSPLATAYSPSPAMYASPPPNYNAPPIGYPSPPTGHPASPPTNYSLPRTAHSASNAGFSSHPTYPSSQPLNYNRDSAFAAKDTTPLSTNKVTANVLLGIASSVAGTVGGALLKDATSGNGDIVSDLANLPTGDKNGGKSSDTMGGITNALGSMMSNSNGHVNPGGGVQPDLNAQYQNIMNQYQHLQAQQQGQGNQMAPTPDMHNLMHQMQHLQQQVMAHQQQQQRGVPAQQIAAYHNGSAVVPPSQAEISAAVGTATKYIKVAAKVAKFGMTLR